MKKYNSFRFSDGAVLHTRKPKTRAEALKRQQRKMRKRGVDKLLRQHVHVVYAHMIGG